MENVVFKNIAIAGDIQGINLLIKYIPNNLIKCVIVASNKPQDVNYMEYVAFSLKKNILMQLDKKSENYHNFISDFKNEKIDAIICISYSMLFGLDILELVKFNAFNFHNSLLPKNRGLYSIQRAIMNNESETGVTFHKINEFVNEGDIIYQEKAKIEFTDTWKDVHKRLHSIQDKMLKNSISNILNNDLNFTKQSELKSNLNKKISEKELEIKPSEMSDLQIYNLIRANIEPLESAYYNHKSKKIVFSEFESFEKIQKYFMKHR